MAVASGKARCVTCSKEKSSFKCAGCGHDFCFDHLADHKQELSKQFDEIEVNRDLFRQTLTEHSTDPQKHSLIQEIDLWERDSIKKVRQAAEEARQLVFQNSAEQMQELEEKLTKLTLNLRESRKENDFNETDLRQFHEQLTRLTKKLAKPSGISLQQGSTPLVTKISVVATSDPNQSVILLSSSLMIDPSTKWLQFGVTVAGGNACGPVLNQLNNPLGIYVDDDQTVYIADWFNHRIVEWRAGATIGKVVAGGNGEGNQADQLSCPTHVIIDKENNCLVISDRNNKRVVRWSRKNPKNGEIIISNVTCFGLAIDKDGCLYTSDTEKNEVRKWRMGEHNGTLVAGGKGGGNRLDQLDRPEHIFIDEEYSVYVSDNHNNRIVKWKKGAKEGFIVAGGHGKGNNLAQLSSPEGIVVDQAGTIYVADQENHRIMKWLKGASQGSILLGGNGNGKESNQLNNPIGLSTDNQGNLYVADMNNHRVQKFNIDLS